MIFLVFKWSLDEDYAIFKLQKTTPNYIFLESMWYVLSEFVCVIHGYMRVLCCHGNRDIYAENDKYLSEMTNLRLALPSGNHWRDWALGCQYSTSTTSLLVSITITITGFQINIECVNIVIKGWKLQDVFFSEIYTLQIHRCLLPWQHLLLSWHNPPSSILARTRLL